jgi:hypothetical protein
MEEIIAIKSLPIKKKCDPIIAGVMGASLLTKNLPEYERKAT